MKTKLLLSAMLLCSVTVCQGQWHSRNLQTRVNQERITGSEFCLPDVLDPVSQKVQTIHIPGDYPTIQQGINAATPGDTVLVADGTYYEQINFLGKKPLMVASHFLIDGDTTHITNTIIDGSQPKNSDSASVVYFTSGEDTTSILCGFKITGGSGTLIITPDSLWGVARQGGGIWISGSGAKIRNNIITKNSCLDLSQPGVLGGPVGGGIATDLKLEDFWIVIENNVIDSNYLVSNNPNGGCTGAGIAIFLNNRISNNIIKNNTSKILVNTVWWSQGTGAAVFGFFGFNEISVMQNNIFLNNVNNSNNAFGGGMKIGSNKLTCTNNTFIGNRLESDVSVTNAWGAGLEAVSLHEGSVISGNIFMDNYSIKDYAGLFLTSSTDTVLVENNYFFNNEAETKGGGCGIKSNPALLQNNVFSGNIAGQRGGALYLEKSLSLNVVHLATLINNSFFGNKASLGGAICSTGSSHPLIVNSVLWADTAAVGKEIYCYAPDTAEVAFCNINPGYIHGVVIDGGGNINEDPLFEDPDLLTISDNSPCMNAGTSEFTCACGTLLSCPATDILGIPRPQNGLVDMGAYEVLITGLDEPTANAVNEYFKVFPNPSSDKITIYFPEISGNTQLTIFRAGGEKVLERPVISNEIQISISAFPRGVYFVRVWDEKMIEITKLIKQ